MRIGRHSGLASDRLVCSRGEFARDFPPAAKHASRTKSGIHECARFAANGGADRGCNCRFAIIRKFASVRPSPLAHELVEGRTPAIDRSSNLSLCSSNRTGAWISSVDPSEQPGKEARSRHVAESMDMVGLGIPPRLPGSRFQLGPAYPGCGFSVFQFCGRIHAVAAGSMGRTPVCADDDRSSGADSPRASYRILPNAMVVRGDHPRMLGKVP